MLKHLFRRPFIVFSAPGICLSISSLVRHSQSRIRPMPSRSPPLPTAGSHDAYSLLLFFSWFSTLSSSHGAGVILVWVCRTLVFLLRTFTLYYCQHCLDPLPFLAPHLFPFLFALSLNPLCVAYTPLPSLHFPFFLPLLLICPHHGARTLSLPQPGSPPRGAVRKRPTLTPIARAYGRNPLPYTRVVEFPASALLPEFVCTLASPRSDSFARYLIPGYQHTRPHTTPIPFCVLLSGTTHVRRFLCIRIRAAWKIGSWIRWMDVLCRDS